VKNTPAYYGREFITVVQMFMAKFIDEMMDRNQINIIFFIADAQPNKLDRLSLASIFWVVYYLVLRHEAR